MMRLSAAILRRAVPADWVDDVLRDLEVAYEHERAETNFLWAAAWLAWHTAALSLRFSLERLRERDGSGLGSLADTVRDDVRLTLRSVRRAPLLFSAVVATLAIGIGANTAIFSVLRSVLFQPLPYPAADRLVVLQPSPWIPAQVLQGLERPGAAVESLAGLYPHRFVVTGGERPVELAGAVVTTDFLDMLGAEIALGRGFTADDARPEAPAIAILSHDVWHRMFSGSPDVLARTIDLDGQPHEIVGVLTPAFQQLTPRTEQPEVWRPASLERLSTGILDENAPPWAIPVARLRPDSEAAARAALDAAVARYREQHPEEGDFPGWRSVRWTSLQSTLVEQARTPLLLLQGAVALVLFLACANVANLLLVRSGARRAEFALRAALGASRARVLRQLLTEGAVLAVIGGLAGLAVAALSLDVLVTLAPPDIPRLHSVSIDGVSVAVAAAASVGAGVLLGVLPSWASSSVAPGETLKEGSRTATSSRRRHRMSQALVIGEVTVTLVLLAGAGLLGRSFVELTNEDPGFDPTGVLTVPLSADRSEYDDIGALTELQDRLLVRLGSVPGIESVALANNLPHRRSAGIRSVVVEGQSEPREAEYSVVSAGYFQTLGIPLERGRSLSESDTRDVPFVAVVDASMAQAVWPGADPVGRRFRLEDADRWMTVVGVSAAVRGAGLGATPGAGFYIPFAQRPDNAVEVAVGRDMVFLVKLRSGTRAELAGAIREAVWAVDPSHPAPSVTSLDALLVETASPARFRTILVGTFAALAVIMAVAGMYAVVGQLLGERRHELGVRKALGATGIDLVREVLGWGLRLTAIGVVLGLVVIFLGSRVLTGLLYQVEATDPATVTAATVIVVLMTVSACVVPAVRACRIDARANLRGE